MPDLESIITAQVAAAEAGNEPANEPVIPPDKSDDNTDPPEPEVPAAEGDPVAAGATDSPVDDGQKPAQTPEEKAAADAAAAKNKPAEPDAVDKELEALGIKAPKEGERENRLPHSRIKALFGKAQKKWTDDHAAELKERDTKIQAADERLQNMDNVDRLIATDPDRYIGMLAALHPAHYKKYLTPGAVEKPAEGAKPAVATDLGPRPAPDAKFPDGSSGYSEEQHEKLLTWVATKARQEATADAKAEMDRRLGPIEKERESSQALQAQVPIVRAQVAKVKETWGADLVDKHEAAIVAVMKANPTMSVGDATAQVLVPLTRADRNTMRAELLAETAARPAAARQAAPAAAVITKDAAEAGGESGGLEAVIARAVATLRQ